MFRSIEQWVDYIDEGCDILCINFNILKKELRLKIKITEQEQSIEHQIVFKNIASLYFNGGEGITRFEQINFEEYNWQIFEFSYHPNGIGNLENDMLKEFNTNINFIFDINQLLIAVEAYHVSFDANEFILRE
ncbi:hypothetical protein J32TS6_10100 [Virgibacillus pantothenticus]|uniref:Uncharacterized protein n=1 Tax=Virgibacillus pantothenticus TaxID=1473 RepID=A0A0L0QM30_VIRPA|nr:MULTISPECIES: hypothetical protein [Virgibacillus]API93375.1 hypothetical protein BKP57_17065 [Virgibacillus sp. 6R]KNE19652.1 hypothetical protein AFK71_14430 [Virgibacillus pantothenticus]MBS7428569.1 hypothetical protein [Virgibacillus sp. 19R1-5]MBU8567566.1 hypothetical protein [Virgibacillus pantothenticus]MBU8601354.1 hypothetical protein [Virgibacillus pantothenticus]